MSLLEVEDLNVDLGLHHILDDVSLSVDEGEVYSLIGRNGAGKTTFSHTVMGIHEPTSGKITFRGEDIAGLSSHEIAQKGIGIVPQGRRVFVNLSVEENLEMGRKEAAEEDQQWFDDDLCRDLFPVLDERGNQNASFLSGGEQQMLALARCFYGQPKLILMDEPTEGLAPKIVEEIIEVIERVKEKGITVLLTENRLRFTLKLADYHYVINQGRIVFEGDNDEIMENEEDIRSYLSV